MKPVNTEIIEVDDRQFLVSVFEDRDASPPWEHEEGHGDIRYVEDGKPMYRGEVVLHDEHRGRWVYDFGGAIVKAAREKWGIDASRKARLIAKLGKKPTRSQINAEAVRDDMDRMRGYLTGDWSYVGVCVQIIGPDNSPLGNLASNSVWGIESDGDYWLEVSIELAQEILAERSAAWRAALREARERRYWNTRDVMTQPGAGHA